MDETLSQRPLVERRCDPYDVTIYVGGDYAAAVAALRSYCTGCNNCFSVWPVDYVFVGGVESGVAVRLINYARFPKEKREIEAIALNVCRYLIFALDQGSGSYITPTKSVFLSRRDNQ